MILVTGATGNVGGELVRALARAGHDVRAVSRDPARAGLPEGVEGVAGDLDRPETFRSAPTGVRGAFLLSGHTRLQPLLAALRDAGAERVVLLSAASVLATDTDNAVSGYHLESEAAVRRPGLAWTFLRPHSFHVERAALARSAPRGRRRARAVRRRAGRERRPVRHRGGRRGGPDRRRGRGRRLPADRPGGAAPHRGQGRGAPAGHGAP